MIWEELDNALIFTELDVVDYQEIMNKMGDQFIHNGYAKESYINALIEREKQYPTGLDVDGMGVAIPHTDVNQVLKPAMGIAVLKKPVEFIQMGSDDDQVNVQLVFMLAVVNPSEHLERLQRILAIIQDKSVLEKLIVCKDKQEIIEMIKQKEKTL